MKTSISNISSTERKITVVAEDKELTAIKNLVVSRLGKNLKVAGFRDGKAPAEIIEKQIDQNLLQSEFIQEAVNRLYLNAVNTHKIRPVSQPQVNVTKFVPFTALEFETVTEVIGDIKLQKYKGLKIAKNAVKVSEEDVSLVLDQLRQRAAERKDVERSAENGDQVWIDFEGLDEAQKPVAGADGKNYPLVIGSKTFIPGFEENLIGLKLNDDKEFKVKFPKDYGVKALQLKNVTFKVKINKIQELIEPELNDEFAKTLGEFKTLEDLKADIKKQLISDKEQQAQRDYEDQLLRAITEKANVDVPGSLLTEQVDRMIEEVKRNATYRGQTFDEYLSQNETSLEKLRQEMEPSALERIKAGLVLSEIASLEKITVSFEEVDKQIEALKAQYGHDQKMQEELTKPENRSEIASQILARKTIQYLIENN